MGVVQNADFEITEFLMQIGTDDPHLIDLTSDKPIELAVPENSEYSFSIKFKVKHRSLKDVRYKMVLRKAGIAVHTRELLVGESFEAREEEYSKAFPKATAPGGFFTRGKYAATTTYSSEDEELIRQPWQLEITR